MTENKAIEERIKNAINDIEKIQTLFMQNFGEECLADKEIAEVLQIAKAEHEVLQQYRAIGTEEEIKEILRIISEGQDDVDESGISTGLLHTLLEYAEYKKIGTVDECQEAREVKQKITEIINQQLIAGKDNYKEIYDCFYKIVKVIQDHY